jgi:CDP-glucose 4,6-dehydratase
LGVLKIKKTKMFNNIYKDKKVFVTGHNGFKGSWLCLWLESMGAQITGYSLDPPTQPNHYDLINFKFNSIHGDLRNYEDLLSAIKQSEPDIIFHLAAQSSVLYSYNHPIETLESNLMGTANVLEACRYVSSIKAVVILLPTNVTKTKSGFGDTEKTIQWGGMIHIVHQKHWLN